MSERSRFATSFESQRFNGSQSPLKSARHHFYTIVPLIWDKLSGKQLLLVRFEIVGLFLNKMTTNEKISSPNRDNFVQHIQMELYQQPKFFSQFFFASLKSASNFPYFQEKEESDSFRVSEIIDSKRGGYLNV